MYSGHHAGVHGHGQRGRGRGADKKNKNQLPGSAGEQGSEEPPQAPPRIKQGRFVYQQKGQFEQQSHVNPPAGTSESVPAAPYPLSPPLYYPDIGPGNQDQGIETIPQESGNTSLYPDLKSYFPTKIQPNTQQPTGFSHHPLLEQVKEVQSGYQTEQNINPHAGIFAQPQQQNNNSDQELQYNNQGYPVNQEHPQVYTDQYRHQYSSQQAELPHQQQYQQQYSPKDAEQPHHQQYQHQFSPQHEEQQHHQQYQHQYNSQHAEQPHQQQYQHQYYPKDAEQQHHQQYQHQYNPQHAEQPHQQQYQHQYYPKDAEQQHHQHYQHQYNPQHAEQPHHQQYQHQFSPQHEEQQHHQQYQHQYSPKHAEQPHHQQYQHQYSPQHEELHHQQYQHQYSLQHEEQPHHQQYQHQYSPQHEEQPHHQQYQHQYNPHHAEQPHHQQYQHQYNPHHAEQPHHQQYQHQYSPQHEEQPHHQQYQHQYSPQHEEQPHHQQYQHQYSPQHADFQGAGYSSEPLTEQFENQTHSLTNTEDNTDIPYIDEPVQRQPQSYSKPKKSSVLEQFEMGWERFTISIDRKDSTTKPKLIKTSEYLEPSIVQYAVQRQTNFSMSQYFQQNNLQFKFCVDKNNCLLKVLAENSYTQDDIEETIYNIFFNMSKGLDWVFIDQEKPGYNQLFTILKEEHRPVYAHFARNKVAIYTVSGGLKVAGYENEIKMIKETLCPEDVTTKTYVKDDTLQIGSQTDVSEKVPTENPAGPNTDKATDLNIAPNIDKAAFAEKKGAREELGDGPNTDEGHQFSSSTQMPSKSLASAFPQTKEAKEKEEEEIDGLEFMEVIYKFKDEMNESSEWATAAEQKMANHDTEQTRDCTDPEFSEIYQLKQDCSQKQELLARKWEALKQDLVKIQEAETEAKYMIATKDYKSNVYSLRKGEVMKVLTEYSTQHCEVFIREGMRLKIPLSHLKAYAFSDGENDCEKIYKAMNQHLLYLKENIQERCDIHEHNCYEDFLLKHKELTKVMEGVHGELDKKVLKDKWKEMEDAAQLLQNTKYEKDASRQCDDIAKRWGECKVHVEHTLSDRKYDTKYPEGLKKKGKNENQGYGKTSTSHLASSTLETAGNEMKRLVIQDGWTDLKIKIKTGKEETKQVSSDIKLPWFLVQYVLLLKKEDTIMYFRNKEIELVYKPEKRMLVFSGTKFCDSNTMKREIMAIFDTDVFHHLCYCELKETESNIQIKELTFPEEFNADEVAAFMNHSTFNIFVVGYKKSLSTIFPDAEIRQSMTEDENDVDKIDLTLDKYLLIKNIGFLEQLQKKGIDVTVEQNQIVGIRRHLRQYQQELAEMVERLFKVKIEFVKNECQFLLFPDGNPNERLHDHFRKLFDKQNCFHIQRNEKDIYVLSEDIQTCTNVAKYIGRSIIYHSGRVAEKQLNSILSNDSQNFKIEVVTKGTCIDLVCLDDVFKSLTNNPITETHVPVPSFLQEYFKEYGINCLKALEDDCSVDIKLQDGYLLVSGEQDAIATCKKRFKGQLLSIQKTVSTDTDYSIIKKCESDIDEVTKRAGCIWRIDTRQRDEQKLSHCTYLATWGNLLCNFNLTFVLGDAADIEFDVLILMTNSSLYPFQQKSTVISKGGREFVDRVKRFAEKNNENAALGYIHKSQGYEYLKAKELASIVVKAVDGKTITNSELCIRINNVLAKEYKKQKTIGIEIFDDGFKDINDVFGSISEAVMTHFDRFPQSKVEFYIVSDNENQRVMHRTMERLLKGRKGYTEKIHKSPIKISDVEVICETGLIHKTQAEVIVNPCSKDLILDAGAISTMILQEAGNDIQTQCSHFFPNGINYGSVAVTNSFKLEKYGCKLVFHCPPPMYDRNHFRNNVRLMVMRCLYTAEQRGCQSIAFPALCVGNLGYPRRDVAAAMFDAIGNYRRDCINPCIRTIRIVLFDGDDATKNAFFEEEWRRSSWISDHIFLTEQSFRLLKREKSLLSQLMEEQTNVFIIKEEDVLKRPSTAVKAEFCNYNATSKYRYTIKKASTAKPFSLHDCMIFGVDSNATLKENLQQLFVCCANERVTEMIISSSQEFIDSVDTIVYSVGECWKGKYLSTVCVVVKDENMLDSTLKVLNGKSWISSPWIKVEEKVSKADLFIQIVGEENQIKSVAQDIEGILSRAKEGSDMKAKPSTFDGKQTGMEESDQASFGAHMLENTQQARATVNKNRQETQNAVNTKPNPKMPDQAVTGISKLEKTLGTSQSSKKLYEMQGAIPKQTYLQSQQNRKSLKPEDKADNNDGFIYYDQLFGLVSANINSGIIQYKKEIGDLERWLKMMEKHFSLKHQKNEDTTDVTLEGSFDAIHSLQEYLENEFPEDPVHAYQKYAKEGFISMGNSEYTAILHFYQQKFYQLQGLQQMAYNGAKGGIVFQTNDSATQIKQQIEQYKSNLKQIKEKNSEEDFQLIKKLVFNGKENNIHLEYDFNDKSTVFIGLNEDKNFEDFVQQILMNVWISNGHGVIFDLDNISVELHTGDLTQEHVDCIAISTNNSMDLDFGAACAVASKAGNVFREACKWSKDKRLLKVSECRLTTSGKLSNCSAVALICTPCTSGSHTYSVKDLKRATLNCFREVTKEGHESLALPIIGSGRDKFSPKQCAEAFTEAMKQLQKMGNNHLKRIVFVDQETEKLVILWSGLIQTFGEKGIKKVKQSIETAV